VRGSAGALVVVVTVLGACGSKSNEDRTRVHVAPHPDVVRDCSSHVEGRLPDGWRRDAIVAGPVALYPAKSYAKAPNPNPGARFVDEKTRPLARGHPLDRETQFNGGIVTAWRRCLPLDVFVRGGEAPLRVVISMGAGHCRER
jgi:hypothetical protein